MKDPVYLDTTILSTGKVERNGPFERDMLEKWMAHQEQENGVQTYVAYKIADK